MADYLGNGFDKQFELLVFQSRHKHSFIASQHRVDSIHNVPMISHQARYNKSASLSAALKQCRIEDSVISH